MLKKITVQGFKGFKDSFTFDLSNIKMYEFNEIAIKNNLINTSVIYGPNSCGKTDLGLAIFDIINVLTDKNSAPELYNNYLNLDSKTPVATFKFEFNFEDVSVVYEYFKTSFDKIIYESLIINDEKIFESLPLKPSETFIHLEGTEHLKLDDINISFLRYIYKNSRLSNESFHGKIIHKLFNFVENMLLFRSLDNRNYIGYTQGVSNILSQILLEDKLEEFQRFLFECGVNLILVQDGTGERKTIGVLKNDAVIPFSDIVSTGTSSLALLFYWMIYLKKVTLVFIDEFNAFYHYKISKSIINLLKTYDCQVILTTHTPHLMTNELLRPDCYFLMRNHSTIEPLHKLTDKDLRKSHNLEKLLISGAFDE